MPSNDNTYHVSVLLEESVSLLDIKPDGIYCDLTFGGGGHSRHILSKLGPKGQLYSFDQDSDTLANAPDDERFHYVESNFRFLRGAMRLRAGLPQRLLGRPVSTLNGVHQSPRAPCWGLRPRTPGG